jgi:hypothetical protein
LGRGGVCGGSEDIFPGAVIANQKEVFQEGAVCDSGIYQFNERTLGFSRIPLYIYIFGNGHKFSNSLIREQTSHGDGH